MKWIVVFFLIDTHEPATIIGIDPVFVACEMEADSIAHSPDNFARGVYGVVRRPAPFRMGAPAPEPEPKCEVAGEVAGS